MIFYNTRFANAELTFVTVLQTTTTIDDAVLQLQHLVHAEIDERDYDYLLDNWGELTLHYKEVL